MKTQIDNYLINTLFNINKDLRIETLHNKVECLILHNDNIITKSYSLKVIFYTIIFIAYFNVIYGNYPRNVDWINPYPSRCFFWKIY